MYWTRSPKRADIDPSRVTSEGQGFSAPDEVAIRLLGGWTLCTNLTGAAVRCKGVMPVYKQYLHAGGST